MPHITTHKAPSYPDRYTTAPLWLAASADIKRIKKCARYFENHEYLAQSKKSQGQDFNDAAP